MEKKNYLYMLSAFLGGAVVGCAAALLFAPEKGVELRARIRNKLRECGIDFSDDDIEELVDQIVADAK